MESHCTCRLYTAPADGVFQSRPRYDSLIHWLPHQLAHLFTVGICLRSGLVSSQSYPGLQHALTCLTGSHSPKSRKEAAFTEDQRRNYRNKSFQGMECGVYSSCKGLVSRKQIVCKRHTNNGRLTMPDLQTCDVCPSWKTRNARTATKRAVAYCTWTVSAVMNFLNCLC